MVGGAGNAPVVTSDVCFSTPVLQTGSRNTSRNGLPRRSSNQPETAAGVVASLRFATARQPHSCGASSEGW
jgi:hypothetical protein